MHEPHPLETWVDHYEWVSAVIGIVGNAAFFAGSVLFALRIDGWAKALFIVGSFGMLLRAIGRMYRDVRDRRQDGAQRQN